MADYSKVMYLVDKLKRAGSRLKHKVNWGITTAGLATTMSVGAFSACKDNYCDTDMDCASDQLCEDNTCYSTAGGDCENYTDCLEGLVCENRQCTSQFGLAENTRLPENDPHFRAVEVNENELFFTFSTSASESGIQQGDIVVGAGDGGYLRRVEAIEINGNSLRMRTSQASLTDAIENGSLDGIINFRPSNKSGDYATREQSLNLDFSGEVLYNQSTGTGQNLEVRISDGSLRFTPDLDLYASISMFRINRFSAIASGAIDLDIDVEASMGGRLTASREVAIGLPYVQPFAFSIGPVPVVGTATLQLYAGFDAHAGLAGEVTAGFNCDASLEFGAVYSDGDWREIWNPNLNCDAHSPDFGIEGSTGLEVYLRPELSLMIYGVAGPALDVKPYLSWEGYLSSLSNWSWELAAGISGNLGYRLEVFGRGINRSFELFDWRSVIASDSSGGTTCSDECSPAGRSCYTSNQVEICANTDSDSCLERRIENCGNIRHCDDGECIESSGSCTDDLYENNDTRETAENIAEGDYNSLNICAGDEDWFATLVHYDERLSATIEFDHGQGNLGLELRDGNNNRRDLSDGTGDTETVQYTNPREQTLYLRVFSSTGEENEYNLRLAITGGGCTDQCSSVGDYCSGNSVYNCSRGTDGCLDSQLVESCSADEHCTGGDCIPDTTTGFTCADLGYNCGNWDNGQGGTTGDCGRCGLGEDCCYGTCGPNGCMHCGDTSDCNEGYYCDTAMDPDACACIEGENISCPR